jgi:chromosome segregation ATPase
VSGGESDGSLEESYTDDSFSTEEPFLPPIAPIPQVREDAQIQCGQIAKQNDILRRQMESIRRLNQAFAENLRELQAAKASNAALNHDLEAVCTEKNVLAEQKSVLIEENQNLRRENDGLIEEVDHVQRSHSCLHSLNSELYDSLNNDYKALFQEHRKLKNGTARNMSSIGSIEEDVNDRRPFVSRFFRRMIRPRQSTQSLGKVESAAPVESPRTFDILANQIY